MSKSRLVALVMMALLAVMFIFNGGTISVNVLFDDISALKSLVFLAFTIVGVAIGIMLK